MYIRYLFSLVMLLSASLMFASAPASGDQQSAASLSVAASSASSVTIFKEMATQTEISAQDDEQVKLRLNNILNKANDRVIQVIEKKLSEMADEADKGSVNHACALKRLQQIIDDSSGDESVPVRVNESIFPILNGAQLLEKPMRNDDYAIPVHVLRLDIRLAFAERRRLKQAAK